MDKIQEAKLIKKGIDILGEIKSFKGPIPSEYEITEADKRNIEKCCNKIFGTKLQSEEILEHKKKVWKSPIQIRQNNCDSSSLLSRVIIPHTKLGNKVLK